MNRDKKLCCNFSLLKHSCLTDFLSSKRSLIDECQREGEAETMADVMSVGEGSVYCLLLQHSCFNSSIIIIPL